MFMNITQDTSNSKQTAEGLLFRRADRVEILHWRILWSLAVFVVQEISRGILFNEKTIWTVQ